MAAHTPIPVTHGDGILDAAGALLDIETIEVGEKVYLSGNASKQPVALLHRVVGLGPRNYGGKPGFTLAQGQ